MLRACVTPACPRLIRDDCADRLRAVDAAQPAILFEAKDASGAALTAVAVAVDGAPLADHLDGTAVLVDPGSHTFSFPRGRHVATARRVARPAAGRKEPPRGRRPFPRAKAGRPGRARLPLPPAAPSQPAPPAGVASPASGVPAYVALGVGGAGLAAGVLFTALWASAWLHDSDSACGGGCDSATASRWENKQAGDTISLAVGYSVAAAGGGIGAWLLLEP